MSFGVERWENSLTVITLQGIPEPLFWSDPIMLSLSSTHEPSKVCWHTTAWLRAALCLPRCKDQQRVTCSQIPTCKWTEPRVEGCAEGGERLKRMASPWCGPRCLWPWSLVAYCRCIWHLLSNRLFCLERRPFLEKLRKSLKVTQFKMFIGWEK